MFEQWYKRLEANDQKRIAAGKKGLYPVLEALKTFAFVSPAQTHSSCHLADRMDLKRYMILVGFCLLPVYAGAWHRLGMAAGAAPFLPAVFSGMGQLFALQALVFAVGGFWEVLFAVLRKKEISESFIITGFFVPLIVPFHLPLWQLAIGVSFGIVIGKEIFGGAGYNFFNPALTVRAFLFFAYPSSFVPSVDASSSATYLTNLSLGRIPVREFWDFFYTPDAATGAESSLVLTLAGGMLLLLLGSASWRIVSSSIAGALAALFLLPFAPVVYRSVPLYAHLISGSFVFGIFFMATDPVTSPSIRPAVLLYGFFIGFLVMVFRFFNPAYPEGTMLAILVANAFSVLFEKLFTSLYKAGRKRSAGKI